MTNKPTANFADPLICDSCGKEMEAKPGETYMGSTDGRVWHYGCRPSARSSTPQEPDDDALVALDRLLRMTVPVPAGCVGAEDEPMSPGFVVSIQLVTDEGVHFIIRASGHSSDTLDLVATPRRLALLAPFEAGETREERIARTVAAPNPPYSGIVDEADFTRGEE